MPTQTSIVPSAGETEVPPGVEENDFADFQCAAPTTGAVLYKHCLFFVYTPRYNAQRDIWYNAVGSGSRYFCRQGWEISLNCCEISVLLCGFILASHRSEAHFCGTSTLITLLKQQSANGVVCLAGAVIDRRHRLAEHTGRSTIKLSRTSSPNRQIKHFIKLGLTVTQSTVDYKYNLETGLALW